MAKPFVVSSLDEFLNFSEHTNSPRCLDTKEKIAFIYLHKRFEYHAKTDEEIAKIRQAGFMAGFEGDEVLSAW